MKTKTWKVVRWSKPDSDPITAEYPVTCECGTEAMMPVSGAGVIVEAAIGVGLIIDPITKAPKWFKPDHIRCRTCRREYKTQ